MKRCILLAVLAAAGIGLALASASEASAQGYYRNGARMNPITGMFEYVDYGYPYSSFGYGPWRSGYNGSSFDPSTGTAELLSVSRNPFTGRIESTTAFVNPYTGQRFVSASRYNPYTQQYETGGVFIPPPVRPNVEVNINAPNQPTTTNQRSAQRPGPRVIEVQPEKKTKDF